MVSAVPFPSSPSRNMHPSQSLSGQWEASANQAEYAQRFSSPTPTQASSSSQQKAQQQTPERPLQPHTPLTPPLTPASSTSLSCSGNGTMSGGESNGMINTSSSPFSTPARGPAAPPPTPASAGLLSGSNLMASHMGPPSPVAVGPSSNTSNGGSRWPAPSESRRMRPLPHRIDIGSIGSTCSSVALSPYSERSERSIELDKMLPDVDRVPGDFRCADTNARDVNSGGERYLLVGNVPRDASEGQLRDAFNSRGDVKGIWSRFQETEGLIILAFFDCRSTAEAERRIVVPGQTYFGGRRLRTERMGATALRKLLGDSEFINQIEAEVVVTLDGSMDAGSLQTIVSSFGELRVFSQVNLANGQAYLAEFYDCRHAEAATEALDGRSFFGMRLHLTPRHAAPTDMSHLVPIPLSLDGARQNRRGGSQPASPLHTNNSFGRLQSDLISFSSHQDSGAERNEASMTTDTSNSSPFHGSRALPLVTPLAHSHSAVLHAGGGRRISTGSVGILPGGALHQSTSEQDLRRRAAANSVTSVGVQDGWITDHARRTSDTFCFDALRRAAGDLTDNVTQPLGIGNLGRSRTRAISESSASPRVVSPSDGFSTVGMDVGLQGHLSFEEPSTPEHSTATGASGYHREDCDRDSEVDRNLLAHTRFPTCSDSSLGGPHTPPPGSVSCNLASYYAGSPSVYGYPSMLTPAHPGAGHCYLGSPLSAVTSPTGMRFGYAPQAAGYSPGGLSVHSSVPSPPSLHSPSHTSLLYSPTHPLHPQLQSPARGALDATRDPPAERNQIDLDRIAAGLDTRTTVMIKNIPNKLSDRDLIEFINRVCPRKIDFLYLRMDFQNGCNVGYAFVNFIHVQDLLHFARTKLGVKWNMFSSEKVLQMSYANYQGKEALVEKFKNSCVMDERESWRPKIFYSSGPNQGLPEPFPSPTHYRRKERSAQNRGALFLHSAHSHGSNAGGEGRGPGPGALGAPFRRPNQHPQTLARQNHF